jgi:hypothetical protein
MKCDINVVRMHLDRKSSQRHISLIHLFFYFSRSGSCFRYARVRVMLAFTVSSRDITSSLTRAHPGRIDDIIHHPPHGLVQQVRILSSGSGYLVVSCSFLFLKTELF